MDGCWRIAADHETVPDESIVIAEDSREHASVLRRNGATEGKYCVPVWRRRRGTIKPDSRRFWGVAARDCRSVALIRQMHARGEARRSSRDATAIRYEGDATPSHPIVSNRRANIFKYGRGIVVQLPAGRGAGPMRSDRGILSRRRRRGQSGVLRLVLPGGILRLRETSQEEWAE